jgi:putative ABC transport system permease protein
MYILKNAWKNITRNKGRNILIGIIIVVISSATAVTLAINNTSNKLITSYENKTEIEATISVNRENMRDKIKPGTSGSDDSGSFKDKINDMTSSFRSASNISEEDIKKYGDSSYVKSYYYTISLGVNADGIEKISTGDNKSNEEMPNMPKMPGGQSFKMSDINNTDFTLVGYSSTDAMTNFINGNYRITSGEVFSDFEGNYAVINSELAEANNLKVGDKITFVDPNNSDNKIELEITGIYEDKENNQDNAMSMFTRSANEIITNTKVVSTFGATSDSLNTSTTPTFILTNKDVIDSFTEELKTKGLSEYLTVSTNIEEIKNSTNTISNVKSFSTTFFILTLMIGGVVLFVINMINIRERKYEIGVLRTIGMKKSTLGLQFVCELMIITVFGLIIGAGIGSMLSVPVSNSLLESEISSSKNQVEEVKNNFGRGGDKGGPGMDFPMMNAKNIKGIANVEEFKSIDAVVDLKVMIELLGVGLLLTLISSFASMVAIERFQPLEILKERS